MSKSRPSIVNSFLLWGICPILLLLLLSRVDVYILPRSSSPQIDTETSDVKPSQRTQTVKIDASSKGLNQTKTPMKKEDHVQDGTKRHSFDVEIDKLRAEFRNNPSDVFSAIKLAKALGQRMRVIHDGGSVTHETIDVHLKAIALVEDTRLEMIKMGHDIYQTASGTKPKSLNEELFLPYSKKSNQGLLVSLYTDLSKQYYIADMFDDSFRTANHVLDIDPTYIDALAQRGMTAFVLGKFDQSRADYENVLDLDTHGVILDSFTGMAKALKALNASEDEWLNFTGRVEELISKYEGMIGMNGSDSGTIQFLSDRLKHMHQALFLYHDGVTKDAEQGFTHLNEAYKLKMKFLEPYNKALEQQRVDVTRQIFSKAFFPENVGSDSSRLIFIIGFPRSGSTLLERIFDAHSGVAGTGEDSIFNGRLEHIRNSVVQASMTQSADILKQVIQQNADEVENLIISRWKSRLNGSSDVAPQKFVDKMLTNYANVGFIHMIFPNALILHIYRDPMSTLWSAFHHEFPSGSFDYTCDIESLAHMYNNYISLIDHWDSVLPGRITHIRYEDIVDDPETLSKSIIAATGLDWEEKVLQFHNLEHAVNTMSSHQVRKGIYKHSNESWKRYDPFLKVDGVSLKEMLGENAFQKYSTTLKIVA